MLIVLLVLGVELRDRADIPDRHYRPVFRLELPNRSPAHVMQRLDDEGRKGDAHLFMPVGKVC